MTDSVGERLRATWQAKPRAHAEVENVQVLREDPGSVVIGEPYFSETTVVHVGDDCEAHYTIGVMPVSAPFRREFASLVATDHFLYRRIGVEGDAAACSVDNEEWTSERDSHYCYDVWAIRVRDEAGQELTEDLGR